MWSIQLGGETTLFDTGIDNGISTPATIAYALYENFFIIAGIEEPYLKMIKIFVTGETSFDWIGAKYSTPSFHSGCRNQSTFTEECYYETSNSDANYDAKLVAIAGRQYIRISKYMVYFINTTIVQLSSILKSYFCTIRMCQFSTR